MTTSFVSVVKEPKIDIWNLMKISYTQFKLKKKRSHKDRYFYRKYGIICLVIGVWCVLMNDLFS